MAIVSRIIYETSAVMVSRLPMQLPEPGPVFSYFGQSGADARFLDDAALKVRVFTFPSKDIRLTFEPTRVRLESLVPRKPAELPLGQVLGDLRQSLYPGTEFVRYGFNYDTEYRYDAVIPQRHVLSAFIKPERVDQVTHFGWQLTLGKERGARRETYYFKVVSPLEMRVMANVEFDGPLEARGDTQVLFERCWADAQAIVEDLAFS